MSKNRNDTLKARRIRLFAGVQKRGPRREPFRRFWRGSVYLFARALGSRRARRADCRRGWRNVTRAGP